MRQAGILAAAGLHAIDYHLERMAEDHANARILAGALAEIPGVDLDPETVDTNIVIADVSRHPLSETEIVRKMEEAGVRFLAIGPGRLRLVTHLDVSRAEAEEAAGRLRRHLIV